MSSVRECRFRPEVEDIPGHWVQDGWTEDGRKIMVFHRTNWNPMGCGYRREDREADERCGVCPRRYG